MTCDPLTELTALVAELPDGAIDAARHSAITSLLAEAWDAFDGSSEQSMAAHKVRRAEKLRVEDDCIHFEIERHGGTVMGSSRAEVQTWVIDLEQKTAAITATSWRQVHPADARQDMNAIAIEIANNIEQKHPDDRYSIKDGELRINVGKFIKANNKQTLQGRRRRFREAFRAKIEALGWKETRPNAYTRQD